MHKNFRLSVAGAIFALAATSAFGQLATRPCQALIAEAAKDLRRQARERHEVSANDNNWILGFATLALSQDEVDCVGIDLGAIPDSLSSYPQDELRTLIRSVRREGGRVCVGAARGHSLGGFALDENQLPVVLLAGRRLGHRIARGTLRHERAHFELWRATRNAVLRKGERPEDANHVADALLNSPLGIAADEAVAVLADLDSQEGHNPFRLMEDMIPFVNYPDFRALVSGLLLRRHVESLRPRVPRAAIRWLDESLDVISRRLVDRTARFRKLLAEYFRRRTGRTEEQARAAYREVMGRRRRLDMARYLELPRWVRDHMNAKCLEAAPEELDDYFGTAVRPEPDWMQRELARRLGLAAAGGE